MNQIVAERALVGDVKGAMPDRARERRLMGQLREALTAAVGRPVGFTVVLDDGQGER
jgi:hypothetical protein